MERSEDTVGIYGRTIFISLKGNSINDPRGSIKDGIWDDSADSPWRTTGV